MESKKQVVRAFLIGVTVGVYLSTKTNQAREKRKKEKQRAKEGDYIGVRTFDILSTIGAAALDRDVFDEYEITEILENAAEYVI